MLLNCFSFTIIYLFSEGTTACDMAEQQQLTADEAIAIAISTKAQKAVNSGTIQLKFVVKSCSL
jgi:hypothetical protein